jgi:hypothetical protein
MAASLMLFTALTETTRQGRSPGSATDREKRLTALDLIETNDRTVPTGFNLNTAGLYDGVAHLRQRMLELDRIKA